MVDANILHSACGWQRWPYHVIQHALRGDFQLVVTRQIIAEAELAVTTNFPQRLGRFRRLLAMAKPEVAPEPSPAQIARNRSLLADPDDVPIALAAINAKVDCFVTEDKHFTEHDEQRAELHRRLTILLSGTFLRDKMQWTSEQLEAVRRHT